MAGPAAPPRRLGLALGNTTLRWIVWAGDTPAARGEVPAGEVGRAGALAGLTASARGATAVLASVNPPAEAAVRAALAEAGCPVRRLGTDLPVPLRVPLPEPERVGVDRLCAALAAHVLAEGAAIVVDAGTAITVGAVSSSGEFRGGAILPGPALAARALAQGTALLPEASPSPAARALGRTTAEALAAGIGLGLGGAVRALVAAARAELAEPARVLGTGGGLSRLGGCADVFDRIEPDLVLIGIRIAADRAG